MIQIREYEVRDAAQVEQLFQDTVHTIIGRDYTQEQVNIWVEQGKINRISRPLEHSHAYVAEENERIVGFADITSAPLLISTCIKKFAKSSNALLEIDCV